MSVVNKMLQDLEARQDGTLANSADYLAPQRSPLLSVLWLALVIIIVLGAYFMYERLQSTQPKVQSSPVSSTLKNKEQSEDLQLVEKNENFTPPDPSSPLIKPVLNSLTTSQSLVLSTIKADNDDKPKILEEPAQDSLQVAPLSSTLSKQVLTSTTGLSTGAKNAYIAPLSVSKTESETSFSKTENSHANNDINLEQEASIALAKGDNAKAIENLQLVLAGQADNLKIRKKLSALLFAEGRQNQAAQVLQTGIELSPHASDLRLMLARLWAQEDKAPQAAKLLSEHQPTEQWQIDYLGYRASLNQKLGDNLLAQQDYQTLSRIEPTQGSWWLGLALSHDKLGERQPALRAYKKARDTHQLSTSVASFVQQRITLLTGML